MYDDGTRRPAMPISPLSPHSPGARPAPALKRRSAPRRRTAWALAAALTAGLLAGCGTQESGAAPDADARAATEGFPVTIENCGIRTTYQEPPSRAVTIHQHPAELMLALGLQDRMVGTAFPDSAVLPQYADAFGAIPELAEREPSFETVLEAEPDFVYGGYGSAFDEKEGRSRRAFSDAGIDTYLNREYCGEDEVHIADAYDEIRTVGSIFGVDERAEKLVAELKARVDEATSAVDGVDPVSVFVYDSGDKAPFTAGGKGLGTEIIRLAGGRNVFDDLDAVFGDASWEQVVARKPEVIAIYDYAGSGSVEEKKEFLLAQPALADVPAVRDRRFVVLPLTATLVGVRPPLAVEEIAQALHPERFA